MTILELGAGTGGATKAMLSALRGNHRFPSYTKYHFTDVSMAFSSVAEEKFSGCHNLEFGLLDIEKDPASQGYTEGSFDVIFASNVSRGLTST